MTACTVIDCAAGGRTVQMVRRKASGWFGAAAAATRAVLKL